MAIPTLMLDMIEESNVVELKPRVTVETFKRSFLKLIEKSIDESLSKNEDKLKTLLDEHGQEIIDSLDSFELDVDDIMSEMFKESEGLTATDNSTPKDDIVITSEAANKSKSTKGK